MKIEHISVSRVQLFEQCHAAYRFKYHMKLPSCEPEPFYYTYGKIVHKIAEEYVKNKAKIPIGRVALDILEGRTPLETRGDKHTFAPKLPPEYSKRLPEHINSVGKITKQMGVDGDVEYEFFYDLDEPHKRYAKGFIDRVIPKGNKIVILDEPTSAIDNHHKKYVMKIISQLMKRKTVILITHDPELASLFTRVVTMKNGQIVSQI